MLRKTDIISIQFAWKFRKHRTPNSYNFANSLPSNCFAISSIILIKCLLHNQISFSICSPDFIYFRCAHSRSSNIRSFYCWTQFFLSSLFGRRERMHNIIFVLPKIPNEVSKHLIQVFLRCTLFVLLKQWMNFQFEFIMHFLFDLSNAFILETRFYVHILFQHFANFASNHLIIVLWDEKKMNRMKNPTEFKQSTALSTSWISML